MPEPCPRVTQLWDVPCPDPPPAFVPHLALAAPDFGLALWGQSIGDHVGLTHKPRGESHYRSRTESQIERRSGRCLTWLWSASLSCSAGPAPCTRDESVSARFAVGVGCTAAGASGWPTLAPSLEPDPASPCDCGWSGVSWVSLSVCFIDSVK